MRVTSSNATKNRRKKLFESVKGFRTSRKHSHRLAKQAALKAGSYSYRDRRNKKRTLRASFIVSINAALSQIGLKYNIFISSLKKSNIEIDRKILSTLAKEYPEIFKEIAKKS